MWTINLYQLDLHWTCIQCNRNLGKLKDSTYSLFLHTGAVTAIAFELKFSSRKET